MTTFKKMKNVLIVDDNPSDIVIAKFVAEQQELNPVIVNDGFSALQALESNDFSLFGGADFQRGHFRRFAEPSGTTIAENTWATL